MDQAHPALERETDKVVRLLCGSCLLFGPQLTPISTAVDDRFVCCLPLCLPGLEELLSAVPQATDGLERIAQYARILNEYQWPLGVRGVDMAIKFLDRSLDVGGYWAVGGINLVEDRTPDDTLFVQYPTDEELTWFLRRETIQFFDASVDTVADLEDHAPPSDFILNRLADKARVTSSPKETCLELGVLVDLVFPQMLAIASLVPGGNFAAEDELLEILARAVYGPHAELSFLGSLVRRLRERLALSPSMSLQDWLCAPRGHLVPVNRWMNDRERPRPSARTR
jgi:hypothetical protein